MKYLVVICMFTCFFMTSCMIQTGWGYFVQGKINNYQVIKCSPNSSLSLSNIESDNKLSDSMKVYFVHKTLSDVDSIMYNNFEYHFLLTGNTIPVIRINSLKLLDRKGAILPTYLYYQYSYSVKRGKLIAIEQIPFDIPPPPGTNGRYKAISLVLHSVRPNSSTPFLKVIWDISIGDQQIADTIEYRFKKYYDIRPLVRCQ